MAAKKKGRKNYRDLIKSAKTNYSELTRDSANYMRRFYGALQELQYEAKDKELKNEVLAYAKTSKLNSKALAAVDEKALSVVGKYCTILNHGGELPEGYDESLSKRLAELVIQGKVILEEKKAEAAEKKDEGPQITVQDRVREQVEPVAQVFDEWVDQIRHAKRVAEKDAPDPLLLMQSKDFKAAHVTWVKKFFEPELAELKEALAGKDPDLKEGYDTYTKTQLKRMIDFLEGVLRSANMLAQAKKATRKPRAKKAPTLEKQVARLKYKTTDDEYGIASVNPVNLIGAKEIWVFNTKLRKLGRYVALDEAGIGVKGAALTNIATETSVQKTLRKPKEQLADFMSSGKVKVRKFLETIRGVETKMKPRLNENIVLLKVVK